MSYNSVLLDGYFRLFKLQTTVLIVSLKIIYHVRKVGKKDPEVSPDEICERIFKAVDVDGDGE